MKQPVLFGSGGGDTSWSSVLVVTAPAGSRVTISGGGEVITIDGTGSSYAVPIHKKTTSYTITAVLDGMSSSATPITTTNTAGQLYYAEVKFGTINVTLGNDFIGSTISCTKSGTTISKTATSTSLTFRVNTTGTWTISGVIGTSAPYTVYANVTDLDIPVPVSLYTIPDGETVLPINNIKTWLSCANIDKDYTTLAEVLADEEVLFKVLTDDNANKYLKRSTEWIRREALVPKMTGDTTPEGEVFYTSTSTTSYLPWKMFDGDDSTIGGAILYSANNSWIGYEFASPKKVNHLHLYGVGTVNSFSFKIQGANSQSDTFVDLSDTISYTAGQTVDIDFNNNIAYKCYRLFFTSIVSGAAITLNTIQLYSALGITDNELAMQIIGADDFASDILLSDEDWCEAICNSEYSEKVLNIKVPTLTSDSDRVIATSSFSSNPKWHAFDGNSSTSWTSNSTSYPAFIGYKFDKTFKLRGVFIKHNNTQLTAQGEIRGSNDDALTNWTTLETTDLSSASADNNISISNDTEYKYYSYNVTGGTRSGGQYQGSVAELQFYGREAGGVQTLLKAAGISKPYTTIDELLADHDSLQKVISSHAVIDYLVTAKSFIDEFTSDATAMRLIGKRNYAANTLLGDEDWNRVIYASSYINSVLPEADRVPQMTDATHPSGEVTVSSTYSGSNNYFGYKAFSSSESFGWIPNQSQNSGHPYIIYQFDHAVRLFGVYTKGRIGSNTTKYTAKLIGSNDNFVSDIHEIGDVDIIFGDVDTYTPVDSVNAYAYYKIRYDSRVGSNNWTDGYGIKLQFYGRTDVDESYIDIYGAASDNDIYYLDSSHNPVNVGATDTDGHGTVARTNLPNGIYTLYSSVAKNPNDLTEDYFKTVEVTNDTIEIMLMPDDSLYWWGHEDADLEDMTTANGWSYSGLTLTAPTHNTQNISLSGSASTLRGIASKKSKKVNSVSAIANCITAVDSIYGWVATANSKNLNSVTSDDGNFTVSGMQYINHVITLMDSGYVDLRTGKARNMTAYALWCDVKGKTPTYLSAAYDTLYIMDGATKIPIATTNGEGKSFDHLLEPGTYEIYSSVAKDPDNLNDDYHQTVVITAATQKVYVMPANTLYWWGYLGDEAEELLSTNGWGAGIVSPCTLINNTANDNSLSIGGSAPKYSGIGTKNSINAETLKVISKGTVNGSYKGVWAAATLTKVMRESGDISADVIDATYNIIKYKEVSVSGLSQPIYGKVYTGSDRTGELYAFWYE